MRPITGFWCRVTGWPGRKSNASCLIEARELAGASDAAYVDRSAETVACFTLVFDTHQIFCVNGLPVESFLPTASAVASLSDDFRDALVQRFPQLRREPNSYPPAEYRALERRRIPIARRPSPR